MATMPQRFSKEAVVATTVGGWLAKRHIASGKTAAVFEAVKDGQVAALKVFDPELVERAGRAEELQRIGRAVATSSSPHPNLVRIIDGGECASSNYLYLVMELVQFPSLKRNLPTLPPNAIRPLIRQLASAAKHLHDLGIVHRDIKPDNIAVSPDFTSAKLLDLGVIRPFAVSDLTDSSGHQRFIGTLRYAAPEFVLRQEAHSEPGWRALTFYQLGGVLHDMIMKTPLFERYSHAVGPMVRAIMSEVPAVASPEVDQSLIVLARNCLAKDADVRNALVKWSDFEETSATGALETVRARLSNRRLASPATIRALPSPSEHEITARLEELASAVQREVQREAIGSGQFPPHEFRTRTDVLERAAILDFRFAQAPALGLTHRFSFVIVLTLVDPTSDSVEILATAHLGPTRPAEPSREGARSIYRGPLSVPAWQEPLKIALYDSFEAALNKCGDTENGILGAPITLSLER
jgi:eukaryotic-like serine/threonine-protein kinase